MSYYAVDYIQDTVYINHNNVVTGIVYYSPLPPYLLCGILFIYIENEVQYYSGGVKVMK